MCPLPDNDTISTYGGQGKQNYGSLPPSNQITDWDNTKLSPAVGNVAEMTLTAPRFSCRLQLATTTGGLSVLDWNAVWGNVTTTAPIPVRVTTGSFTITLPAQVSDEYSASIGQPNTHTTQLKRGICSFEGNGTFGFCNVSAVGNVITIYTADHTGAASDMNGVIISVWVR